MRNNRNKNGIKVAALSKKLWIAVVCVFVAVLVGITCGLCFVGREAPIVTDDVQTGVAETSANQSNLTGNGLITAINNGQFSNGNYVDYSYNGSSYSVNLPMGTYKFELWGAQGGSTSPGQNQGGKGSYVYGQIAFTAQTTIYIYIGGRGTDAAGYIDRGGDSVRYSGGYNGGGTGSGYAGPGGGGATDIRWGGTAIGNRKIVASGGGGGYGGSVRYTYSGSSNRRSYTLYYGENGCSSRHSPSYPNDEAGGGGGYYGGAVVHSDDPQESYAGSNYCDTTVFSSSNATRTPATTSSNNGGGTFNNRSGNGTVRITAVSINKPPVTKNASFTNANKGIMRRGVTGSAAITASEVASDPEGTAVAFTDGNSSNFDTLTTTANSGLTLSTGGSASKYFNWTWNSTSQFTITSVNMYPRAGVDGCTTNGTIPVYAKVRDTFSGGSAQRGTATVSFNITVPVNTINERTGSVTAATNNNKIFVGKSNTTTAPTLTATQSTIYNPLGTNRYTAIFESPLRYDEPVTIRAADLVVGDCASNAIRSGDQFVVALNSTTAITGTSRKYQVDEYTNNTNKATAYNASRVAIANAFTQLSFRCLTPDPTYQVFSVTVYQIENNTAYGNNTYTVPNIAAKTIDIVFKMDNTRPVLKRSLATPPVVTVSPTATAATSVNLNTYYSDDDASSITTATHQIKEVIVPTREFVQLDKYGNIVSTVHTAGDHANKSYFNVLPADASANMLNDSINTGMLNGEAYSTGFQSWYITSGASNTAFVQYSFSGVTLNLTGLRSTYSMYKSGRTGNRVVTGGTASAPTYAAANSAANAGHFYILIKVQDKNDTADGGIWLPLGIIVSNAAPTDLSRERGGAGASAMPTAEGAPGDSFYFTPMGITVNQVTSPVGWYNNNGVINSVNLRPLGADSDNFFTSNMLNGTDVTAGATGKLNELLKITSSATLVRDSVSNNSRGEYFDVDTIEIYVPEAYFGGRLNAAAYGSTRSVTYNGNSYSCVVITGLKVTLHSWTHNRYFHANVTLADSANQAVTVKLAVKVNNTTPTFAEAADVAQLSYSTDGKNVSSSYSKERETITYNIPAHSSVIVTPYDLLTDANMATAVDYPANGFTLNGLSGMFDTQTGVFAVDATRNGTNDTRTRVDGIATSANAVDYSSASYKESLFAAMLALQTTRTFGATATTNSFGNGVSGTTNIDRLYFERRTDSANLDGFTFNPYGADKMSFADPAVIGSSYVSYHFGSSLSRTVGTTTQSYNLDYIIITATGRTQSAAPVEMTLNVRDRMGAGTSGGVKSIKIVINVVNSSPRVQYPNQYYTLTTNPVQADASHTVNDASSIVSVTPSTLIINATTSGTNLAQNFLIDDEDSNVSFYYQRGVYVVDQNGNGEDAYGNSYITYYLRASINASTLTLTAVNSTQAVQTLYVTFSVTDGRSDVNGDIEYSDCRIKVEVVNASIYANRGSNGFTPVVDGDTTIVDNLWNVETLNEQDITKSRYFTSSAAAETALAGLGVTSVQTKRLVTDTDALQGVVLTPASQPAQNVDTGRGYVTANGTDAAAYRRAVPTLGYTFGAQNDVHGNNAGTATVLLGLMSWGQHGKEYGAANADVSLAGSEILYFVDGEVYTASELATGVMTDGKTDPLANPATASKFFDDQGRWIVTDWAVKVTPLKQTSADSYVSLRISMRDETRFGGGTAGKNTAFRQGVATTVTECKMYEYCLFVNSIGIVPYTYYNQFDGYYTVADGYDPETNYVSTYDGTAASVYRTAMDNLYVSGTAGNKVIVTSAAGATELKTRAVNDKDNTAAGVHSGVVFDRTSDDYAAGYDYEVYEMFSSSSELSDLRETAFRYSDTIRVAGEGTTYVPMSYFGLRKALVNVSAENGAISFPENLYVGYDVQGAYERDKGFQTAVSVSDGVNVWRGINDVNGRGYNLADNPYVNIASYDVRNGNTAAFNESTNSPYFNKALAITTYGSNGKLNDTALSNTFGTNLVGNGHLMYLAGQESGLQENLFGLTITKKNTRSNAATLTITVAIAECQDGDTGTIVNYDAKNKDQNTATLTFKLEIENSPISLTPSNSDNVGAVADAQYGYYTTLDMNVNDGAARIALSRTTGVQGADRTIVFSDNDKVTNADGSVNVEKSDKAKFYMDSLRRLGSWASQSAVERVTDYTELAGGTVSYNNASDNTNVQASLRNYFNASNGMNDVDSSYKPNGGVYGTVNEGYSNYFGVEIAPDGESLYITPRAKTVINSDMISGMTAEAYYRTRGLRYVSGTRAYYPLKVLIYDDHGDGFNSGTYVSLEIRIYISGAAPTLNPMLEDHKTGNVVDGKQISVALPVGQSYSLNIKDVISAGTLITDPNSGNIFWQQDYTDLKNSSTSTNETFRLESGTYLMSPFIGWVPNDVENRALLAGNATFSSNQSMGYDVNIADQNDVVMYMAYRFAGTTVRGPLTANAIPDGNSIFFAVNRRTTTTNNGVSTQVSNFSFHIRFTDSDGNRTEYLYVNIEVTNQAPTIRSEALVGASAFTSMRVGDSFTVLTTPYDRFIGSENGTTTPSRSYLASTSYQRVNSTSAVGNRNLLPTGNVSASTVRLQTLTSANLLTDAYKLHNFNPANAEKQHLGYLAIADDDTPWGLRIVDVTYYDASCFDPTAYNDRIAGEGTSSSNAYALDVTITAHSVCRNMPITITVEDADGARTTFTMYVTVESSRPSAIPDNDREHVRHAALLSTGTAGVYETYMISSSVTTASTNLRISNGSTEITRTVYGSVTIPVNQIAYDPDVEDNRNIALYNGGTNGTSYNVFTFNGISMDHDGLIYSNDYFRIVVDADFKSFTITCLTYNPTNDWDVLGFYIRDCGNDIFGNAIFIQIRLTTLYSSITNDAQTVGGNVTNTGMINTRAMSTVYVKSYDDYNGTSETLPEDEDELNAIVGVNSTYQFLPYKDVPQSIDQQDSTARGLNDPDVLNSIVNRNYELRVYALLNLAGEAGNDYTALSLAEMSALFDLTPTNVGKRYWYLKSDASTVNQVSQYLVGGFYADGSSISGVNSALSMFLQKYFVYDIGLDGVSLTFRPVTANLDINIPMYVQITKSVNRDIRLTDVSTTAGTLFYVKVNDSAPIANDDEENISVRSFKGKIGDSVTFKIHDKDDRFGSLFNDSDSEDTVTVAGFLTGNVNDDYTNALADATELGIAWQRNGGKVRAIDIEPNNTTHTITVSIKRRIDMLDDNGKYLNEVTVPINITGTDRSGKSDTIQLLITICNSDFDIDSSKLGPVTPDERNGYYQMFVDQVNSDEHTKAYIIEAYVVPNKPLAPFNFLTGAYIADPDYTSMNTDTDSYRLVSGSIGNPDKYLMYDGPVTVHSEKKSVDVAVVTPVFGSQTMPDDEFHFAGFSIDAKSYDRSIDDAVMYMRIVDRSGNDEQVESGITVTLYIHILNAPPTLIGAEVTNHVMIGSETSNGTPIVIDINDYVSDPNGDVVKIVGVAPVINDALADDEIDPNIHCTLATEPDGEIVIIELSEDLQKVTITPKKCFYGKQSLYIMVADGDLSTGNSISIIQFRHDFTIVYDIGSMGDLNRIEAVRSLPTKVTPEKLFKSITDLYGTGVKDEAPSTGGDEEGGATASAAEARIFNPGSDYVIAGLTAEGTGVTINKDGDGDYQFVCNREAKDILFHVTFKYAHPANAESAERTFQRTFYATVGKNTAPTLLSTFKDTGEDGYLFLTGGGELGLDNNGTVILTPSMLFHDVDIAAGDKLSFDVSSTEATSPTVCSIRFSDDGSLMYLTFNYRGETDLTVGVCDRTGEVTKFTFKVKNIDRPEPSFWDNIMISYETYPIIFWGIGIGILVIIFLIILIALLVKRRKRKREELEAILISEMELEEQMMRLSGGIGSPQYQSFGYLPPTMNIQNDPGLMLGTGAPTPGNGAIGLNPGQDNGVPTDSDM